MSVTSATLVALVDLGPPAWVSPFCWASSGPVSSAVIDGLPVNCCWMSGRPCLRQNASSGPVPELLFRRPDGQLSIRECQSFVIKFRPRDARRVQPVTPSRKIFLLPPPGRVCASWLLRPPPSLPTLSRPPDSSWSLLDTAKVAPRICVPVAHRSDRPPCSLPPQHPLWSAATRPSSDTPCHRRTRRRRSGPTSSCASRSACWPT